MNPEGPPQWSGDMLMPSVPLLIAMQKATVCLSVDAKKPQAQHSDFTLKVLFHLAAMADSDHSMM